MKFSDSSIGHFKELAKRELGLMLSDDEAQEYADRIITLVRAVVEQPQPRGRDP